jgi:hypothetical protein
MHVLTTFWPTTLLEILSALIDSLQILAIQFIWRNLNTSFPSLKTGQIKDQ